MIFVEPYISTARAVFYEDLKAATIVDDAEDASEEANPGEIAE